MQKIHVLSPGFTSPNGAAFLYPLIKFSKALRDCGVSIRIYKSIEPALTDCDHLLIDSKYFKSDWSKNFEATLERIAALGQKTRLYWCDQSDSSGTFLGQVMPFVHRYLKAQYVTDKTAYLGSHYASRIYTDYYHRKYGITDKDPYLDHRVQNPDDLAKIGVSWNSAFMHYGVAGPYILRLKEYLPLNIFLPFSNVLGKPDAPRTLDITCRMGISYARETVCYQRRKVREILADHLPTDKLSRPAYFREMGNSKICVSPFGLGEITLKDFECFLSGAMLIKPDMSHMTTWPNLFQDNRTCLFHDWDMNDLRDKIDWALSHEKERIEIAQNAQDLYADHTIGKDAPELFARHFQSIIST